MSKNSVYFRLSDMSGKHDVHELKKALAAFPGVLSVSANESKNSVAVDYDSTGITTEKLERSVKELGYTVSEKKEESHQM